MLSSNKKKEKKNVGSSLLLSQSFCGSIPKVVSLLVIVLSTIFVFPVFKKYHHY